MIRPLAVFLLLFACAPSLATAQQVMLVRHAEKADDGTKDPPLTPAGEARAQALAVLSGFSGLDAVYSSPLTRSVDTGLPAASQAGLEIITIGFNDGMEAHIAAIAASARMHAPGDHVLIVGHSNTIPLIIAALGGPSLGDIDEDEYNRLFFLDLSQENSGFREVRFGAP